MVERRRHARRKYDAHFTDAARYIRLALMVITTATTALVTGLGLAVSVKLAWDLMIKDLMR